MLANVRFAILACSWLGLSACGPGGDVSGTSTEVFFPGDPASMSPTPALSPSAMVEDGLCDDGSAPSEYRRDNDGDGYAQTGVTISLCEPAAPAGFVDVGAAPDCDDNNTERRDSAMYYPDADADGFGDDRSVGFPACVGATVVGMVTNNLDCDDTTVTAQRIAYVDLDQDGYGGQQVDHCESTALIAEQGWSLIGGDCDDERDDVYPESPAERPLDGYTYDCDEYDFATSHAPVSDEQLDAWVADVPPAVGCSGVDLYVLHLVPPASGSAQIVFGNRGTLAANAVLRLYSHGLQEALVAQQPIGVIPAGGWLRVTDVSAAVGEYRLTAVHEYAAAECNPQDNDLTFTFREILPQ